MKEIEQQFKEHNHDGTNSYKIHPVDLLVFTQLVTDATASPSDTPQNGTMRILTDGTNYRIWCRVNKLWKYVNLS